MARQMPRADVVIVGMGWTGGIAARELAQSGLRIVGLERGHHGLPTTAGAATRPRAIASA